MPEIRRQLRIKYNSLKQDLELLRTTPEEIDAGKKLLRLLLHRSPSFTPDQAAELELEIERFTAELKPAL